MTDSIRVVVTGAAGQIGYSLLYPIAKGDVFGKDQKVVLVLLDITPMLGTLGGVVMELQDCALPLLEGTVATDNADEAFTNADVAILVGAMPRRDGMERKDLLNANVKIFKAQGESIDKFAKKSIKIVVVGNPANTNALICRKYAPSIPATSFTCLTRLDQNRAQAQIAAKIGIACDKVYNTIIWGNHSSTQFPDVKFAKASVKGEDVLVYDAVTDDNWLKGDFITTVQKRGGAVIAARKLSSAMSAAKAICDHMRDWWFGTSDGRWVSMGVISNGEYGIEEGLMYSYPVTIKDKKWTIVTGLEIDDFARAKMDLTATELSEEKVMALDTCSD